MHVQNQVLGLCSERNTGEASIIDALYLLPWLSGNKQKKRQTDTFKTVLNVFAMQQKTQVVL